MSCHFVTNSLLKKFNVFLYHFSNTMFHLSDKSSRYETRFRNFFRLQPLLHISVNFTIAIGKRHMLKDVFSCRFVACFAPLVLHHLKGACRLTIHPVNRFQPNFVSPASFTQIINGNVIEALAKPP